MRTLLILFSVAISALIPAKIVADDRGASEPAPDHLTESQEGLKSRNGLPLLSAAEKGDEAEVRTLLSASANVNAANKLGNTALMLAADNGHLAVARLLIAAGAEINAANKSGFTALMNAADQGDLSMVETLVIAGADVNARSKVDYTALHMALRHPCDNDRPCRKISLLVRFLISNGADVDAVTKDGETALMVAAALGNAEAVSELLATDVDTNKTNSSGETAYCLATKEGYTTVAELLKSKGTRYCRR